MKAVAILMTVFACAACQRPSPQDRYRPILDRIADECDLPRSTFKLIGDDQLTFQFDPNARFERVDCALAKLKKANLPVKLGFIGNEYYSNEVQ